jgi:RNA 2',3'-cyclic 3'-phosphodiesterase
MRLFIALDPQKEIRDKLAAIQAMLADTKAAVRWVDPADYHVTIKFLGEVEEHLVPELSARLARAAEQVPAFELEVEGVDRFPARGPARVIISRIISPDQRITKLHRLIDSGVGGMGLPMDTRVLTAHLTLGRVQSNHSLNRLLRLIEKHDLDFFGNFKVETVRLYHSIPQENRMHHKLLCAASLHAPAVSADRA